MITAEECLFIYFFANGHNVIAIFVKLTLKKPTKWYNKHIKMEVKKKKTKKILKLQ